MRYTNPIGFEKHLASSALDQLCRIYLIISADFFERHQAMDAVVKRCSCLFPAQINGEIVSAQEIITALDSPSLLNPQGVVIVDNADKKLLDDLSSFFKEPRTFGYLVIGSSKASGHFAEIHGVILDLTEEKPWDRDRRWMQQLHDKAKAAGKKLTPDAAEWLVGQLERDAAIYAQEMDKLVCYCAYKSVIERFDAEKICSTSRNRTIWQVADDLVWTQTDRVDFFELKDSSFFYGLIANLRIQLGIGVKIHGLLRCNTPFSEWGPYFPRIWSKTLEKKSQIAQRLGAEYFRCGLNCLFDMELMSKNDTVAPEILFDSFRFKLKKYNYKASCK
jgi:DNA polymerase-3 subunit delta